MIQRGSARSPRAVAKPLVTNVGHENLVAKYTFNNLDMICDFPGISEILLNSS